MYRCPGSNTVGFPKFYCFTDCLFIYIFILCPRNYFFIMPIIYVVMQREGPVLQVLRVVYCQGIFCTIRKGVVPASGAWQRLDTVQYPLDGFIFFFPARSICKKDTIYMQGSPVYASPMQ
ncbi:pB119L [African swine fever virus]|uniref:PB119L n=1 Tax=African swine fever virus TaxID=10497 RepID=A0A8A1UDY5_ASF|nr:pB119L [African swine fever virus]